MAKIIAYGKHDGHTVEVVCIDSDEGLQIDFDGHELSLYEEDFRYWLKHSDLMGGTYRPPEESMLNAYNVLQNHFFDDKPEIIIEGNIEIIPQYDMPDIVY